MVKTGFSTNLKKSVLVVCLCLAGSTLSAADGFFARFKDSFTSGQFIEKNGELLSLLRCLSHVPYIATADSQNPVVIKATAALAAAGTGCKLGYELHRQEMVLKTLLYYMPKSGGYTLSAVYDFLRFFDATKIAEKNKERNLRSFKINQSMQLFFEVCLRVLSVYAASTDDRPNNTFASYTAELADIIELWRLLSRWETVVNLSDLSETDELADDDDQDYKALDEDDVVVMEKNNNEHVAS